MRPRGRLQENQRPGVCLTTRQALEGNDFEISGGTVQKAVRGRTREVNRIDATFEIVESERLSSHLSRRC
jgi:hypothetical protein